MKTIQQEDFTQSLYILFKEAFEGMQGEVGNIFLDRHVGIFSTLGSIEYDKASMEIGNTTIAAQCEHVRFYLDFLSNYMSENFTMVDWKDSWKTKTVSDEEWTALRGQLQKTYQKVTDTFNEVETWNDFKISGALGILAHTAYHLSAIRQILKFI